MESDFQDGTLIYTPRISSFGEAHDPEADAVYKRVNEEAEWGVQRNPKLERRGVYNDH